MLRTSRRVRRLEKDAILRSKDYEYTRQQSDNLLSKLDLNVEEEEDTERNRRHITTRPIRQIQKDADYPVESLDKITERIQQEVKRRQMAASSSAGGGGATAGTTSTTRNYRTLSTSKDDRTTRDSGLTGKYSSNRHTSGSKY